MYNISCNNETCLSNVKYITKHINSRLYSNYPWQLRIAAKRERAKNHSRYRSKKYQAMDHMAVILQFLRVWHTHILALSWWSNSGGTFLVSVWFASFYWLVYTNDSKEYLPFGMGFKTDMLCLLFVACLTSQQHTSVSQGRICTGNFTCCHTEIEVADQTFYLTQSQYINTGPISPSSDPITPGAW